MFYTKIVMEKSINYLYNLTEKKYLEFKVQDVLH